MKRLTVRWRLTAAFATVMAVVLTATGLFVYQRQASNLDRAIARSLRARAADVAALAQQSDTGLADARQSGGSANRTQLAQIINASGRVIDRTPGVTSHPVLGAAATAAARRGATVMSDARLAGARVRLYAEPVHAQDQTLVIVVGQSLADRNLALSNLGGVLLVGGPLALLLASSAGYLLIRAALRPVEDMRRQAASISAADLDQRLPPAGGNDELGRLGRTLNEMLARVHESVRRERTLVSDASHELRTPLAVLRTELELIGRERPSGSALQSAIDSAIEETDRLNRLAEDLLLLARADEHQLALNPSPRSAATLLHEAVDRAGRGPAAEHVQITVAAAEEDIVVDPDRIAQALDNLLANALRHADGHVHLSARRSGRSVELHVTDDGPGFPVEFLPTAWERFARADPGRTEDGTGLGLAIVRAVAEAHGGQAQAANLAAGGADVWITLPSQPAQAVRRRDRGCEPAPGDSAAPDAGGLVFDR